MHVHYIMRRLDSDTADTTRCLLNNGKRPFAVLRYALYHTAAPSLLASSMALQPEASKCWYFFCTMRPWRYHTGHVIYTLCLPQASALHTFFLPTSLSISFSLLLRSFDGLFLFLNNTIAIFLYSSLKSPSPP